MASRKSLSTADVPVQFLKSAFLTGNIPFRALAADPRVSYTLYIPSEHYNPDPELQAKSSSDISSLDPHYLLPKLPLLVNVHGTGRNAETCRNILTAFADSERVAILAPLFPAALDGESDLDSYKLFRSKTLQSDKALFAILEEVKLQWPGIETEKILLAGFSGGGQFAQRFFYLYPEKLLAVSIGAPGHLTVLDRSKKWPNGIGDVADVFGPETKVDIANMKEVKHVQLIVGSDDTEVHGGKEFWAWLAQMKKHQKEDSEKPNGNENMANSVETEVREMRENRLDALKALKASFDPEGIHSRLDIVEGIHHDSKGVFNDVQEFFRPIVRNLLRG